MVYSQILHISVGVIVFVAVILIEMVINRCILYVEIMECLKGCDKCKICKILYRELLCKIYIGVYIKGKGKESSFEGSELSRQVSTRTSSSTCSYYKGGISINITIVHVLVSKESILYIVYINIFLKKVIFIFQIHLLRESCTSFICVDYILFFEKGQNLFFSLN